MKYIQILILGICLILGSSTAFAEKMIFSGAEKQFLQGKLNVDEFRLSNSSEICLAFNNPKRPPRIKPTGEIVIKSDKIVIEEDTKLLASKTTGFWGAKAFPLEKDKGGIGGGYGGRGGTYDNKKCIEPYSSTDEYNILPGSFGGNTPLHTRSGGYAGGKIILIGNDIQIDGIIEANGEKGEDWTPNPIYGPKPYRFFGAGGGSGGGILIIAKKLNIGPHAVIQTNGGDGGEGWVSGYDFHGYPGSGGRIKIFYEEGTISESAQIEAKGGLPPEGGSSGGVEDGTIFIQQMESIKDAMELHKLK